MNLVKPPYLYFGAKVKLAPWIISYLPDHYCYVEVFGGSAAILLNKNPSAIEVYNDINSDLVNIWKQIRDNYEQLSDAAETILYSRELHTEWLSDLGAVDNPTERAARAIFMFNASVLSMPSSRGFRRSAKHNHVTDHRTRLSSLLTCHDRFQNIIIEHLDFANLISQYDSPNTLFYLDPPYSDLVAERYEHYFNNDDHKRLADVLSTIAGKAIISYNDSTAFREYYRDWHWITKDTTVFRPDQESKQYTECLIMNYEPAKQLTLF